MLIELAGTKLVEEQIQGGVEDTAGDCVGRVIGGRIAEFDSVDKGSYSFRYPVTLADLPSLPNIPRVGGQQVINLLQVRDVITQVALTLDGATYGIADQVEMREEYEAIYDCSDEYFYGTPGATTWNVSPGKNTWEYDPDEYPLLIDWTIPDADKE
ncbi:MAG: hypothetical protein IID33_06820 [Planctomycetes bacterium]|nr:hypothetical protein [Planctomycetota bacterium]